MIKTINKKSNQSTDHRPGEAHRPEKALRFRYILGLSIVALLTLTSQFYVQAVIKTQTNDASLIDLAGRQRMLSQRIAKLALLLDKNKGTNEEEPVRESLSESLKTWEDSHKLLANRNIEQATPSNSEQVDQAYGELEFYYRAVLIAGKELVSSDAPDDTQAHISRIIHNETEYLPRMHAIVGMLGDEATDRVNSLKMIETALCASIIIALVLEILLVFEPAARKIASQFNDLEKAKIRLASEFNALNRSTPRAEVNLEGKITEANDQFLNCLQYSRGEFLERPLSSLIQDKKQKSLHEEIWQDVLQGNYRTEEVKWLSQSGEEKHIQSTLNPIKDHNGNVTRIVIYANDFTENVLAEQEKQRLNSELNEAARQAGMAEVATGVLHNIGNVLTSVNVSASVLRNQITSIPMRHLARAADIIGENRSNLAEFLTEDDRGKKFPVFLEQLTNNFETGHTELLKEADDLSDHVEHIIELISMQQSVAGRGGTMQNIELSNLVNDAIHLNQSSLNSHYVEVTRELEEEVTLATNRHEILQILVNLIRNGLQATRGIQRDPTLTVVAREQDGFAVISVTDNGVGIAKEDLCKLFEYGYTTKEDGNGFGLHASANTANALGGKVTVVSDGIDQGATSVLRIPLTHPKAESSYTPAVNSQAI